MCGRYTLYTTDELEDRYRVKVSDAILTTTPNKEMDSIHDRMPVILHKNDEAQWLAADTEKDIAALLRPYTNDKSEAFEVSTGPGMYQ